ncbi:unnamed protein product [Hymenolepis diminuta]|uniref:DUF1640 domain-containing protein n=1 Tax=Hymenolepis diminuta TaxID=6216 RepID=A0A0R3SX21_HYMDI|nr:unnamed protein product [Hymenolepis diminuta]
MNDSISFQEIIKFAENYAALSGQDLKNMTTFKRVEGNPVCEQLRADLNQLSEDQARIDSELKIIKVNQERARTLLKEFGFE